MVAYSAGIIMPFMGFMIKRHHIHSKGQFSFIRFFDIRLDPYKKDIRLLPFEPGNLFDLFDLFLGLKIVAPTALHRPCGRLQAFLKTADRLVRSALLLVFVRFRFLGFFGRPGCDRKADQQQPHNTGKNQAPHHSPRIHFL